MKTMKEIWVCPDAQVQVFMAQEFCQGPCGPTETDKGTLYAQCSGDQVIVITQQGETNRWAAQNNGNPGEAGILMQDLNDPTGTTWVFAGPISHGHDNSTNLGEWIGLDQSAIMQGKQVGDYVDGYGYSPTRYCVHETLASERHHHLTNGHIVYVNHS
ncbi:MAG: hypothetical protein IJ845_03680 [Bacteroidaceae bacterium]|nr:hypothetical protein [Bacteroidaceae bacterium]